MIGDTVYNVAVGYEKSTRTAKMYVNGNKVKEGTIQGGVGGIEQAFTRFTIGNSSPTANQGFEGVIDEVAVWQHNTATDNISDAEAQAIYNFTSYGGDLNSVSGSAFSGITLKGWYRMGEDVTTSGGNFVMQNEATGGINAPLTSDNMDSENRVNNITPSVS